MGIKNIFAVFIFILILGSSLCFESEISEEFGNLAENYAKWVQKTWTPDILAFQGRFPMQASNLKSHSKVPVVQYSSSANSSVLQSFPSQCTLDLFYVTTNLKSEWAIRMLDSDGKLPSGMLDGNVKWPGDYKECIEIYSPASTILNISVGNFYGRYCTATWTLHLGNLSLPLSVGVCVPDSCSGEQIKLYIQNTFYISERFPGLKKFDGLLNLTDMSCKPREIEYDGPAIGMMFLLSVFGFLMVAGSSITIFEYFMPPVKSDFPDSSKHLSIQNHSGDAASNNIINDNVIITTESAVEDKWNETEDKQVLFRSSLEEETQAKSIVRYVKSFLKSFCVFTNGSKLLNTDVAEGQLQCVHGIRFLSMAWVILGHTYAFAALNSISNISEALKAIDTWQFQVILQGTLSVDSFFVLSGFLLTYLFLKEADKREGKISWPFFYIHRYWRLTPVYMITLGFDTALTRYLSSGPFWSESGFEPACKQNWWRNLLYINNFGPSSEQCFGWAWYLANDMQFYVISPIFLYALWRWPKVGLSIVCTLLLSSWITSGVISTENDLISTYSQLSKVADLNKIMTGMTDFFTKMYVKPYTRIGPYLIGVLVGYILYRTGSKKKFLEPWFLILGWSVATALPLLVIFGVFDTDLSTLASAVFNAIGRSAFAIGLSWVIYACLTGHGDIVNKILSWKMFIPLSRLTYCAYLVHPIVIVGFYQSLQQPLYFAHLTMVVLFFGFLVLSYMVALITSLTLESPMMGIEKLLLRKS